MAEHDLAAVVAAVLAALGETPASAPASAAVASPFAVVANVKPDGTSTLPATIRDAMAAAPDGERQTRGRLAAAYFAEPGFACDAITRTINGPEGPRNVGHGFITPHKTGDPCGSTGCTGKVL